VIWAPQPHDSHGHRLRPPGQGSWAPSSTRAACQVRDAIYQHLKADARRAASSRRGPGGHPGNDTVASVAGLHPADRLFGQATPGPAPTHDLGSVPPRPRSAPANPGGPGSPCTRVRLERVLPCTLKTGGTAPVACAGAPRKHSGGKAASFHAPFRDALHERQASPAMAIRATTLRVQEFDRGRGPVGLPPIGQACYLPHGPIRVLARVPLPNSGAVISSDRGRRGAKR